MGISRSSSKKGPLYDPQNHRLINRAPVLARLLGRIVKAQLIDFLTANDLTGEVKHAILRHRSCTSCHYALFDRVTLNIYKKKVILTVFLDINKALDPVPHEQLLLKLKSNGLADPLYSWLTSSPSDRPRAVSINGTLSQHQPITSSVIQASLYYRAIFLTLNRGRKYREFKLTRRVV